MASPVKDFLFRLFRANETRVHELNYLFWECTTRCNLHCRHCGSDCMAASKDVDMPLEDFLSAFDTIPRNEIPRGFTVVLTGGSGRTSKMWAGPSAAAEPAGAWSPTDISTTGTCTAG